MLNKDKTNLLGIIEAAEKIEFYISTMSNADELYKNSLHFDAVLMNFVVIGECVDRLTHELKETNSSVNWVQIKSFRNLVAHDYFGVDAEEVWQIITTHLKNLKIEIQRILNE